MLPNEEALTDLETEGFLRGYDFVVSDLSGVAWMNKVGGERGANAYLRAYADKSRELGIRTFRGGGSDEFVHVFSRGEDPISKMDELAEAFSKVEIPLLPLKGPTGKVSGFRPYISKTFKSSEDAIADIELAKKRATEAGWRVEKGKPQGLTIIKEQPGKKPPTIIEEPLPSASPARVSVTPADISARAATVGKPAIDAMKGEILVNRSELMKLLAISIQRPFGIGKFMQRALGIAKIQPGMSRIRSSTDVETLAHETGHHLQKILWPESVVVRGKEQLLSEKFLDDMGLFKGKDELLELSKTSTPEGKALTLREGFAEYIRHYVSNPKIAKSEAPEFHNFFDEMLRTQMPETRQQLLRVRSEMGKWKNAKSSQKVAGAINRMTGGGFKIKIRDLADTFYTGMVHKYHPFRRLELLREVEGYDPILAVNSPGKLAQLFDGEQIVIKSAIKNGAFDWNTGQLTSRGLVDIFKDPALNGKFNEFWDYMAARRVVEDLTPLWGKENIKKKAAGLDFDTWNQAYKELGEQNPEFVRLAEDVYQFQQGIYRYYAESYGFSEKQISDLFTKHGNYVPFYRVMDDPRSIKIRGAHISKKFGDLPRGTKKIRGSERELMDPAESVIGNTHRLMSLAHRNKVGVSMIEMIESTPGFGKIADKIPIPMKRTKFSTREIKDQLDEIGVDTSQIPDDKLDELMSVYRPLTSSGANEMFIWRNGKQELWHFNDSLMYETMQGMEPAEMNVITKMLKWSSDLFKTAATATPEFVVRNTLFRDFRAALTVGKDPLRRAYWSAKGLASVIKQDDMYKLWERSFGSSGGVLGFTKRDLEKLTKELMKNKNIALRTFANPYGTMKTISRMSDEPIRVGEFMRVLDERGVTPLNATRADLMEAATKSRWGVTLDFMQSGKWTKKTIKPISGFWNPAVLGFDQFIRRLVNPKTSLVTVMKGISTITIPAIYEALKYHDDPRYKELPAWQKNSFDIYIEGGPVKQEDWDKMSMKGKRDLAEKTIWRGAGPFEIYSAFGAMAKSFVNFAIDEDPKIKDQLWEVVESAGVSGLIPFPPVGVAFAENQRNRSFFTGKRIDSKMFEFMDLEPKESYTSYTPQVYRKLGSLLDLSPKKIQHAIASTIPGLERYASEGVDYLLEKSKIIVLPEPPEKTLSDLPFIKSFTARFPTAQSESISTFWDEYSKVRRIVNTIKLYDDRKEFDKMDDYIDENGEAGIRAEMLYNVSNILGTNYDISVSILQDPDMTPQKKRSELTDIYIDMSDMSREVMEDIYKEGALPTEE